VRIVSACERVAVWHEAATAHDGVFWHGSPSGEFVGSPYGVHVGTYEAAREALEARIGRRADGKPWDGTQEYGKTLLDRNQHSHVFDPATRTWSHHVEEFEPAFPTGRAAYSDGTPVPMHAKPDLFPVRITGPMSNTPETPHSDWKANGYMRAQTTKGTAKRGYYYANEGEGVTHDPVTGNVKYSVSAVVPNGGTHLERLPRDQHPTPQFDAPKYNSGYSAGF